MELCVDGRFDILALAGSGGMGTVYRARDRSTGEIVALKLLNARGDADRLAREARLLASLDHPGIVRHLAAGTTAGARPYLAMEWLSGHDLDDRIARGAMGVDEVIGLAKRLAEPLAAAHRRGIIHRDLKPANVFLVDGEVDRAKLIDFGLARQHEDTSLTADGTILGTPAFMAPEQIRGEALDARADVYALGAVVFTSLIGRPPFGGVHRIAVLAKAVAQPPPRLAELRFDVPASLDALVMRLLAKEREHRPADGDEVIAELAAVAHDPVGDRRSPAAITRQEQRVACIVLCDAALSRSEATIVEGGPPAEPSSFGEIIEELGGALHLLTRDTALVTLRGLTSPAQQAARAARCALAVAQLGATTDPSTGNHVKQRTIVIATGRVIQSGAVQVGEVIDRATHTLLRATRDRDRLILVDETTADLLRGRFILGGDAPWFTLIAETGEPDAGKDSRDERSVFGQAEPASLRGARTYVGRTSELAALEGALAECEAEPRARAVSLVAAAGMGKSRLLRELCARIEEGKTARILQASADPLKVASFGVAGQLLHHCAGISSVDGGDSRAWKLRTMIEQTLASSAQAHAYAFLGEIAGVYASEHEAPAELAAARADATMMADAMREAWIEWLRALTGEAPLVIIVDDLQWADAASVRLLDAALDELAERPLLVVGSARPEIASTMPELWKQRSLQVIHLGPLAARAARALVEGTLGAAAQPSIVEAIVERAAGHPFFLEELVRAVSLGRGADALPTSVLGLIESRFDELSVDARRVLRAASVFGATFTATDVLALLGSDATPALVASIVRDLQAREILQRRSSSASQSAEQEHAFRHALFREAAYATLTEGDRTLAHRLAGECLELRGGTDPAVLAEHFDRGAAPERALDHFRRAARMALARSDLERAASLCTRALGCGPDEAMRAALWAMQSEIAYWRGDLDGAADRAAAAASKLMPGCVAWFEAASAAIGALGQKGHNDDVAIWLDRVTTAASNEESRGAHINALCRGFTQLAWAHHRSSLDGVRAALERVAEPIEQLSPFEAGWVHRVRAEAAWLFDRDIDRCLGSFQKSVLAFELAHAQRFLCLTQLNFASLQGWAGDVDGAIERATSARQNAERHGWRFLAHYGHAVGGMLEMFAGEAEAQATMRVALKAIAFSPRLLFITRTLLGWLALERADLDEAEAMAGAALELSVVDELRVGGKALRARVLLARGDLDGALAEAQETVALQRSVRELELFEGAPFLALADVLEARGDRVAAAAAIEEGHARLCAVAETIGDTERRDRFWTRRVAFDQIRARRTPIDP